LSESEKLRSDLEIQYQAALKELDSMRGENEELNKLIDQQAKELSQRKAAIEKMIGQNGDLSKAKSEMRNLRVQLNEYLNQIKTLQAEKDSLLAQKDSLSVNNMALQEYLDSTKIANKNLSTVNADLSSQNQQLSLENAQLAETVNVASVIKVKNINVIPLKLRSTGKAVKKTYAKNVEQLRICFQSVLNDVASSGKEYFLVRIINPVGETMSFADQGAGVFVSKKTGEEIPFSTLIETIYESEEKEFCLNWTPTLWSFMEGKYKIEVYNKGHMAGTGSFELK
jgi:uncharacterized phage infection (PIP) family protein YhgE